MYHSRRGSVEWCGAPAANLTRSDVGDTRPAAMKALVTILQCRRVVCPYLFIRHALPRMQQRFPGEIEVLLIQHQAKQQRFARLQSAKLPADREQLLAEWTAAGRYQPASVLRHAEWHEPYPNLPSMQIAAEEALRRKADFHVWLEDDAMLVDEDCDRWEELLAGAELGVYRSGAKMINHAWFISRPSFDQRILPGIKRRWMWRRFSRLESWLRTQTKTAPAELEPRFATRHHHKEYPYTGMPWLVAAIAELCPEELDLLTIDFGETAERAIQHYREHGPPVPPQPPLVTSGQRSTV